MDDFRKEMSYHLGPGGMKCPCCNDWYYCPRKGKEIHHRIARRKLNKTTNEFMYDSEIDSENNSEIGSDIDIG